jgi:hypothetical protein
MPRFADILAGSRRKSGHSCLAELADIRSSCESVGSTCPHHVRSMPRSERQTSQPHAGIGRSTCSNRESLTKASHRASSPLTRRANLLT